MSATKKLISFLIKEARKGDPGDWKPSFIDQGICEMTHRATGAVVWCENRYYATRITIDGVSYPSEHITAFTCFFGWMTWRRRLVRPLVSISKLYHAKKNFEHVAYNALISAQAAE